MFIEEYLQDLRRERFGPPAVALYARRLARHVRADIVANLGAVRSVWTVALVFFAVAFVASAALALFHDRGLAYEVFLQSSVWIVSSFALVTFGIGLLRDRAGYRLSALNVPLVLTLLRISLVPWIAVFLLDRQFVLALGVFLAAALTDVADGWLARRWDQVTRLGTVLDPIVDIVFNLAMFAGLHLAGMLALWVFLVAALRYGLMLVGGAYLYVFIGPVHIQPTLFGRLTGILMSALVALIMLLHAVRGVRAEVLMPLTERALGVLLAATVLHVLALGWYNLRLPRDEATVGRVVGDVRWGGR